MSQNIKVDDMPLSSRIKKILTRYLRVNTLEELVSIDYEVLKRTRGMGEVALLEVKDYVHSLGYSFKNENGPYSTKEEELIRASKKPLSSYGFSSLFCSFMYKNGIFTLEDILDRGSLIERLEGMSSMKMDELHEKLDSLGLVLEEKENNSMILLKKIKEIGYQNLSDDERDSLLGEIKISELDGMDSRGKNALIRYDVETLKQLIGIPKEDMIRFRNLGYASLGRIEEYLNQYGISLYTLEELLLDITNQLNLLLKERSSLMIEKEKLSLAEKKIDEKILKVTYDIDRLRNHNGKENAYEPAIRKSR